jgi:HPt (histidine-containing phosphotransfer) domain-containing protein
MAEAPPPIDLEEFRAAMRASGIEEIVTPMLGLFAQEAPKGMALLSSAIASGDLEAVSRAAHSLKSTAGNVRAKDLAALLQQLEAAGEAKDGPRAARLFESVRGSFEAAMEQLRGVGMGG